MRRMCGHKHVCQEVNRVAAVAVTGARTAGPHNRDRDILARPPRTQLASLAMHVSGTLARVENATLACQRHRGAVPGPTADSLTGRGSG